MQLTYYPGCTLKTKAGNFEESAIALMKALDVDMVELERWNCCGTVYSLAGDDLVHQVAPIRTLIRVKEQGDDQVLTLCSFCYNTLKRANLLVKNNQEKLDTLNSFMSEEIDYDGSVEAVHLLSILRDQIGWETIAGKVKNPLTGLKLAPYYGCTLLRPEEIAIDDVENPSVLEDAIETAGAEAIDFAYANECCGSYQAIIRPDSAAARAFAIMNMARRQGADAIVVSCPLCSHNLGAQQERVSRLHEDFEGMPVIYFTQLLAIALGLDPEVCKFELNPGKPEDLLREKGIIK